jgi:hypothetical protein
VLGRGRPHSHHNDPHLWSGQPSEHALLSRHSAQQRHDTPTHQKHPSASATREREQVLGA